MINRNVLNAEYYQFADTVEVRTNFWNDARPVFPLLFVAVYEGGDQINEAAKE
ncbi:hypothetical protein ACP4OV_011566 [Aristida adscensionis]